MRNRYPGTCYFCSKPVGKREGHFEKIRGTRHGRRTIHAECVFEQRRIKAREQDIKIVKTK